MCRKVLNLLSMASIAVMLASCTNGYLGKRYPEIAKYSCPISSDYCSLNRSLDNWQLKGSYNVEKIDDNRFQVSGRLNVDTSEQLSVYTHSRITITFYFFRSDEIVERLDITVRGKVNRFNEFSKSLVSDKALDSSTFQFSRGGVSEVPL